jgi:hypothetical protein
MNSMVLAFVTPSPPFCKTCNVIMFYVNTCVIHMCYVVHKQANLTWTTIHLSTHEHLITEGKYKNVEKMKTLIHDKVSRSSSITPFIIALVGNKTFFFEHILNKDAIGLVEFFKGMKLHEMMDKFITMCSPNI